MSNGLQAFENEDSAYAFISSGALTSGSSRDLYGDGKYIQTSAVI